MTWQVPAASCLISPARGSAEGECRQPCASAPTHPKALPAALLVPSAPGSGKQHPPHTHGFLHRGRLLHKKNRVCSLVNLDELRAEHEEKGRCKKTVKQGWKHMKTRHLRKPSILFFFLPQRAWTVSRFVAFTTSCFQNITIKSKQTKMR